MVAFLRATLGFEPEIMREGMCTSVRGSYLVTLADCVFAHSFRETCRCRINGLNRPPESAERFPRLQIPDIPARR